MTSSNVIDRSVNYQESAYLLNDRLPVSLSAKDVRQCPEFCKLLEAVSEHLTDDGDFKTNLRELSEAKETLMQQKRRWLQNHRLYSEIRDLVLDHSLQSAQLTPSSNSQFYKMVGEMLGYAEIGEYLDCSMEPGSDVTLLGLTVEKLDQVNPHRTHKQSMLQKLIPDVESRLRRRCEALVNFHDTSPEVAAGDSRFEFAKASQLPVVISAECQKLAEEKKKLKKEIVSRRRLSAHYQQLLNESFELLNRLLVNHRLKSQPENDVIAGEWLAARCDAMCLKIKVLELQLLYDTYYAETVHALTVVRSELDTSIADAESELNRTTSAVCAYESVGAEFDSVVDEFSRLRAEVENRRWALHELKKHSHDQHGAGDSSFLT